MNKLLKPDMTLSLLQNGIETFISRPATGRLTKSTSKYYDENPIVLMILMTFIHY
jgi:hypothetical protein